MNSSLYFSSYFVDRILLEHIHFLLITVLRCRKNDESYHVTLILIFPSRECFLKFFLLRFILQVYHRISSESMWIFDGTFRNIFSINRCRLELDIFQICRIARNIHGYVGWNPETHHLLFSLIYQDADSGTLDSKKLGSHS